jgi:hypothetical protein
MAEKAEDELHWDEIDDERDDPTADGDEAPRRDIDPADVKDDVVEYFGADGDDEGPKLMQNADGTWGEEQNAAG